MSDTSHRPAEVELLPLGFVVNIDHGPEYGMLPVSRLVNGKIVPLYFAGRPFAKMYAQAHDAHSAIYAEHGYCEQENEAREVCKTLAKQYGRVFVAQKVEA
jgi:hypothetical protein